MIIAKYLPKFTISKGVVTIKRSYSESPSPIPDNAIVKVTKSGNIIDILFSEKQNSSCFIRLLDKNHYCDLRTGEIKECQHIENRQQNLKFVANSLKVLRNIINANVLDISKCRWLTLTYAENMQDPKRLQKDFEHFIERIRKRFGQCEYISVAEPQARGAWHLHVILLFDCEAPFMENMVVRNAWKRGFVNVRALDNVDNVGAYLTAYLGDIELSEAQTEKIPFNEKNIKVLEFEDDTGQKEKKAFIKGGRLHMYPPNFNIYRCSKGIKKPDVTRQSYKQAMSEVGSAKLTYNRSVILSDTEHNFENTLTYESYNTVRK